MAGVAVKDWERELADWLAPFLAHLDHRARRRMCPLYVAGLLGPGERKSVQPMAGRLGLGLGGHDQLHHFVASPAWDDRPLEAELARQADALVGGPGAVLVVDDTALPKKGSASVGVAPQYAGSLGKRANCQTLVSLTLAQDEVPVPVALRLFLPQTWADDPARLDRAGVPEDHRTFRTKPELALTEIDRLMGVGVRFGCVLADAEYGISAAFRQGLSARRLLWAVGIPRIQKVYPANVAMIPHAGRGRAVPDQPSLPAEMVLAAVGWQAITWRHGTKGALTASFAAMRGRVADGPARQIRDKPAQHLPGDEVWVIGEHRASGETKYYLANLPVDTDLTTLAALLKARWVCEQAHQQMKEELGLGHFEGRSWTGLHRRALLTMIALAILQHRRLAFAARGKKAGRPAALPQPPSHPAGHPRPALRQSATAPPLSPLPTMAQTA